MDAGGRRALQRRWHPLFGPEIDRGLFVTRAATGRAALSLKDIAALKTIR